MELSSTVAGSAVARSIPSVSSWWSRNRAAVVTSLVLVLALRLGLGLVTLLAFSLLPEQQGQHAVFHRSSLPALDVWARWDSEYYLDIAEHGYGYRDALTGFFPLYPLLMRAVAPLVGGDWVLAGIVVSTLACWIALAYLFRLASLELDSGLARRAVLYAAVFPAALFLLAVYSESLYLALTVATIYHARQGQWPAAAIVGFLAGLTRANSIILVAPLAYEAWRQTRNTASGRQPEPLRSLVPRVLAIYAAPLGLLAFAGYLARLTGDPLAYVHSQGRPPFARHLSWPWQTMATAIQHLAASLHDPSPLVRAVNLQDLTVAVLLIVAAVVGWWRLPRVHAIYGAAATLFLLSSTNADWPLQSMLRYSLTVFPVFLLLAQLGGRRWWGETVLLVCAPLLGMYAALFAQWYWVF